VSDSIAHTRTERQTPTSPLKKPKELAVKERVRETVSEEKKILVQEHIGQCMTRQIFS